MASEKLNATTSNSTLYVKTKWDDQEHRLKRNILKFQTEPTTSDIALENDEIANLSSVLKRGEDKVLYSLPPDHLYYNGSGGKAYNRTVLTEEEELKELAKAMSFDVPSTASTSNYTPPAEDSVKDTPLQEFIIPKHTSDIPRHDWGRGGSHRQRRKRNILKSPTKPSTHKNAPESHDISEDSILKKDDERFTLPKDYDLWFGDSFDLNNDIKRDNQRTHSTSTTRRGRKSTRGFRFIHNIK